MKLCIDVLRSSFLLAFPFVVIFQFTLQNVLIFRIWCPCKNFCQGNCIEIRGYVLHQSVALLVIYITVLYSIASSLTQPEVIRWLMLEREVCSIIRLDNFLCNPSVTDQDENISFLRTLVELRVENMRLLKGVPVPTSQPILTPNLLPKCTNPIRAYQLSGWNLNPIFCCSLANESHFPSQQATTILLLHDSMSKQ